MADRMSRSAQIKIAFDIARERNPKLPWILLAALLLPLAVFVFLGILAGGIFWPIMFTLTGIMVGAIVAMGVLSRQVNKAVMGQLKGQPDAAARLLSSMRGNWTTIAGVGFDRDQNLVHRVVGRPGVVLVAEGRSASKQRGLVAAEKRKIQRVTPETPVYEVLVGDGDDQVPLEKVQRHVQKLPRNLTPGQVRALAGRLKALQSAPPMPHGPMPKSLRLPRNRIR